jgi:hypothetical protein
MKGGLAHIFRFGRGHVEQRIELIPFETARHPLGRPHHRIGELGELAHVADPFDRVVGQPDMLALGTPEQDMVDDREIIEAQLVDGVIDERSQIRHAGGPCRGRHEVLHDGKTVVAMRSFQIADEGHREITPFRIGEAVGWIG